MKTFVRRRITRWLEQQVHGVIRRNNIKVVAVTGSFGKTSTKLAIAQVLDKRYKVLAHEGNYNSEIGLPLSIFEQTVPKSLISPTAWAGVMGRIKKMAADYPYEVLVLELGVDGPGDMDAFLRYLKPDIGVVTAVSGVHIEYFRDVEQIADEKFKLALGSKQAVINIDNKYLKARIKQLETPPITFGRSGTYHFADTTVTDEGIKGSLRLSNSKIKVQTHFLADYSLRTLEAAAAVGQLMGLSDAQIQAGIEAVHPFTGRMNPLKGYKGSMIIDDTYNASPDAVVAALQILASLPGKRIAILGTMNELGDYVEAGHRQVGKEAAKSKLDMLVTIGENARRYMADEALKTMKPKQVESFDTPYEAGEFVKHLLTDKTVVLAKGSQNGVFAEEAVKILLADKKDASKLVRQSDKWLKAKAEQFK